MKHTICFSNGTRQRREVECVAPWVVGWWLSSTATRVSTTHPQRSTQFHKRHTNYVNNVPLLTYITRKYVAVHVRTALSNFYQPQCLKLFHEYDNGTNVAFSTSQVTCHKCGAAKARVCGCTNSMRCVLALLIHAIVRCRGVQHGRSLFFVSRRRHSYSPIPPTLLCHPSPALVLSTRCNCVSP